MLFRSKFALTHRRLDGLADPTVADRLVSADADVVISVFFPFILPRALLERVRAPIVNLHPTLLPRYRGPTPLAAMLTEEAGDQFGGVTLHRIVPKVDAGPIIAAARVPLPPDRNRLQTLPADPRLPDQEHAAPVRQRGSDLGD